jgi:protein TonB
MCQTWPGTREQLRVSDGQEAKDMFETAMLDQSAGRGAVGLSGSLLLQTGLVGGALALSLWMPVALPEPPEISVSLPAPRFRNAVRVVATTIERSAAALVTQPRFRYVPPTAKPGVAQPSAKAMDDMLADLPISATGPVGFVGMHGDGLMPPRTLPPPVPKPVAVPDPPPVTRLIVGGDVMTSKLIHRVQPVYPEIARRARIEGIVLLRGVITREGKIADLRVLSGHPLLVKAALDAVSQWVYSPTLLNQKPVEVEAPIEVRFILGR